MKPVKVPGDALPLRLETSCIDICASESPVVKSAELPFQRQEILRLKCKCPPPNVNALPEHAPHSGF